MTPPPDTFLSAAALDPEPWLGYIRVSTWKEEKISPDLQKAAIQAWARRTGRRIVDWIEDLDMTGRNFKRKIMRGIERVEKREAVGIAVWKFSRFGRNDLGIAVNLTRLEHAGGQLESATEEVDARTAVGRFNRKILFDLAVFESDRAGEQWKETHQWRRAHGLPATGGKRLGYIWHPRRIPHPSDPRQWATQREWYQVDEAARATVEDLFARKLADAEGYGGLAAWLNPLGYRTGHGNPWRADSLRRYMLSGFAGGLLRVHDPECRCDYTANGGTCGRWVHIDGAHEAIISPETWERYEEHVAERRQMTPRVRNPTYPLTGLVRCGGCREGAAATSARRASGRILGYAYACGQSRSGLCDNPVWVQRAVVEDEVRLWLAREVAAGVDAAPPAYIPPQRDDHTERDQRERARMEGEHTRLTNALTNLAVDRATNPDAYPEGVFEAARARILKQKEAVTEALEGLAAEAAMPKRSALVPLAVGLLEEWDTFRAPETNGILRSLIRRVAITRGAAGRKGVEGSGQTTITIHPVWEPDPWETTEK
ncbi:recombinase family protein [Streptomyces montanisoli]|uniref:Recombinase family protein n=1 Tax=Streptomyces montanisoli TaxID=2798581 RepID=A0A940RTI3_9ACTN|nr:recombinase family protein [Streptomyces montanisoli]MBP0456216.1 recombinase family protein [Streptomyces montanisoli]